MGTEWGAEIWVNGVRPAWFCNKTEYRAKGGSGIFYGPYRGDPKVSDILWSQTKSICLPADHFAYAAIAKGYEPWGGGSTAPADWDGEHVLFRDGEEAHGPGWGWNHPNCSSTLSELPGDIIGYRKRSWTKGAPFEQEATSPAPAQMTAGEARRLWARCATGDLSVKAPFGFYAPDVAVRLLDHLGFIRPDRTPLEQFLAEHPEADPGTADLAIKWTRAE